MARRTVVVRRPVRRTGGNWIPLVAILGALLIGGLIVWMLVAEGNDDLPGVEGLITFTASLLR